MLTCLCTIIIILHNFNQSFSPFELQCTVIGMNNSFLFSNLHDLKVKVILLEVLIIYVRQVYMRVCARLCGGCMYVCVCHCDVRECLCGVRGCVSDVCVCVFVVCVCVCVCV